MDIDFSDFLICLYNYFCPLSGIRTCRNKVFFSIYIFFFFLFEPKCKEMYHRPCEHLIINENDFEPFSKSVLTLLSVWYICTYLFIQPKDPNCRYITYFGSRTNAIENELDQAIYSIIFHINFYLEQGATWWKR